MPSTWREHYDRVQRWMARVADEFAPVDEQRVDDFYAFFIFCFHMKDWLKADSALNREIGTAAEDLVKTNQWLGICADVANGSKPLKVGKPRVDSKARVEKRTYGFDTAGFHKDAFLSRDMIIVPASGTEWVAVEVAKRCVAAWERFLVERGLLATP